MLDSLRLLGGKVFKRIADLLMKEQYDWAIFKESCLAKKYTISESKDFVKIGIENNIEIKLRKRSSDIDVFGQIFLSGEYKIVAGLAVLNNIEVKNIVDCGANIGLASVYFNSFFPDATIISVEPDEENFKMLQHNAVGIKNSKTLKQAIWFEKTELASGRKFRDKRDWSVTVEEITDETDKEHAIKGITLNEIYSDFNLEYIDILKIDIEGAERHIFLNPDNCEFLKRTKIIALEIHDEFDIRNQINQLLSSFGFYIFESNETTIGVNLNTLVV